jgi:adenine-specific DNA-methyltransferase
MNDEIHETPSATPNFQTELAAQLADLIPEAIADGKVDIVKLQELLGADTADASERFGLFWPGKKRALRAAQEPTTATLRPDFENSKDWDTTQNVFIEGDNLEVLKILQKHYHAKIKLIYIDPPYNTGKDFIYPDNFKEGLDTYLDWTRQVNEEGKKVSTNSETEGRYHSNWLNMMYPRLKLARNLLTDDGVIFISIDDNEQDNLKKLCNEIFGEQNFIADIVWQKKQSPQNDATYMSAMHDYVLVYARKSKADKNSSDGFAMNKLLRTADQEDKFKNPDDDPRGAWISVDLTSNKNASERPNLYYSIVNPSTGREITPSRETVWRYERKSMQRLIDEGRLWFGRADEGFPRQKRFRSEIEDGITPSTWWTREFAGDNQQAKRGVRKLFPDFDPFSTPKPVNLIKRILDLATSADTADLILDFFSGSATTAHAVMEKNFEDGGNRSFLQVQLPEPTGDDSEPGRAGYATISAISRERIRRAGAEIESSALRLPAGAPLDTGFRSFSLVDSHFSKWRLESEISEDALQQHLLGLRENASGDASDDDLLTEILLKQGYSLTEKIEPVDIAGLHLRSVGDGVVLAYLNEHMKPTLDQLRAIVDEDPARIIVLEDAFQGDDELKTNLAQLAKSNGIELWTA